MFRVIRWSLVLGTIVKRHMYLFAGTRHSSLEHLETVFISDFGCMGINELSTLTTTLVIFPAALSCDLNGKVHQPRSSICLQYTMYLFYVESLAILHLPILSSLPSVHIMKSKGNPLSEMKPASN